MAIKKRKSLLPEMLPVSKGILAPSLLSANFSKLGEEVAEVESAGAEWLHIDVMDGSFVPNITVGPLVVQALRPHTQLVLDAHLMVSQPEQWIGPFAAAGADLITIHAEATKHLERHLAKIRELGCKAGVSLNPGTSLSVIEEVLDKVDLVLLMSVNPGFGGQKFIDSTLTKIERLASARGERTFLIEVDGGINESNIATIRRAGCDIFVAGSAIFNEKNRTKAIHKLRAEMETKKWR